MEKIAIFPGSFDPITCGHKSIILRAIPLFDKIIVAIGKNALKSTYFDLDTRKKMIEATFADHKTVVIQSYTGLTIDFCKQVNAQFLLRGLRTSADFEFERSIGQINKQMNPDVETVFLLTQPEHTALNSSIVRDILRHKGNVDQFVPKEILPFLK
ncbi:MAG: pantetheine-phosphate adenylyltransferase [Bacteroidales bacterium]|nr:pantetheine-phosphate adenylyltransferase [Bacteroidales bacterium]